jgi:hypothetical protein
VPGIGQLGCHPSRGDAHGFAESGGEVPRLTVSFQLRAEQCLDKQPLDGDGLGVDDLTLEFEGSAPDRGRVSSEGPVHPKPVREVF